MRRRIIAAIAVLAACSSAQAGCEWTRWEWLDQKCTRGAAAFRSGADQLYLTGYSYHGRRTYTSEKIEGFNEDAWGGGYGRRLVDERGNSHEVYAMAFSDSHAKPQYMAGYGWLARWALTDDLRAGAGFTAFVALRSDFCRYACPVPAVLPLGSLEYRSVSLMASYVPRLPGSTGNGDVLFLFGRIALD